MNFAHPVVTALLLGLWVVVALTAIVVGRVIEDDSLAAFGVVMIAGIVCFVFVGLLVWSVAGSFA